MLFSFVGMHWSKALTHGEKPAEVRSHTCTAVGSKLFFIGGCNLDDKFSRLLVFDTETMFWCRPETTGSDLLSPHRAHSSTLVGDDIFVFGGGNGPDYFGTLYVLNTKTMTWSQPETKGSPPGPRRAHTATLVGRKIYVFGGGDGIKALNEVYTLDTESMTWSECKASAKEGDIPKPRGYHSATLIEGDKILSLGGSDGKECFCDLFVFDTATEIWSKKKVLNLFPRLAHTATLVGSMLFVFGGHDGCEYINEMNLLNLETMEWVKRLTTGDPPSVRGYHTAVLFDSRLWIFGGFDGSKCFDELYILDLGTIAYLASEFSLCC